MDWAWNYWTYLLVELLNISFERSFDVSDFRFLFIDVFVCWANETIGLSGRMFFTWDVRLPPQGAQTSLLAAGVDRKASWHGRRSFLGSRNGCIYWLYPTPRMQSSSPGLYMIITFLVGKSKSQTKPSIWRLEPWVGSRSNLYSRSHAVAYLGSRFLQ